MDLMGRENCLLLVFDRIGKLALAIGFAPG
jgi:hypothetical protein